MCIIHFVCAISKLTAITFLLVLLTAVPAAAVFRTVIASLTIMCASLYSHSFDLIIPGNIHLNQDEYTRLSHTFSEGVLKTSSRRLDQEQYILLGHTSSRCLQDVFETSCQDVLKKFSRSLNDVL